MTRLAERAVIVGTGLIGGSLAAAAKRASIFGRIVGVGRGAENLAVARAAAIVDHCEQDLEAAVAGAGIVVLAAPTDAIVSLLPRVAAAAPADCVITDVGSVKSPVVTAAVELGLTRRFVGAHPMAGGTETGAAHARAELFAEALVVLTPTPDTDEQSLELVRSMWHAAGARTSAMTPEQHDRAVAVISHLPQLVAIALAGTGAGRDDAQRAGELAAGGFRDTARLATSDPAMWRAIAALNQEQILEAMDAFSELWARVRAAVARGDGEALAGLMDEARAFYEQAAER